jgi:hypothetical protein
MTFAASIDPDLIRRKAEASAGVEDSEAGLFDRNLDVLVESLNREGDLSEKGAAMVSATLTRSLANRLSSLKWTAAHPEILQEPIDRPLYLTGLPRSGTTYLEHLFDCDPDLRLPRTWEATEPCPPPAVDPEAVNRRIQEAYAQAEALRARVQNADAIHLRDPEGPDECHAFLAQTFSAVGFQNVMNVPAYTDYLFRELDLQAAYRVHRRQLQILQWRSPRRRWAVKYPNHVIALPQILSVYPDALFIMTHRDPVQTLASLCRLTASYRAPYMRRVNLSEVGPQMLDFVSRHMDRLMAFTDTPEGRARVVSVDYYALVSDPANALAKAYRQIGVEMPKEVRQEISAWRQSNPKGKRGAHVYALEDYGLDEDEVAERFSAYRRRFDVPREAEALAET